MKVNEFMESVSLLARNIDPGKQNNVEVLIELHGGAYHRVNTVTLHKDLGLIVIEGGDS